MLWKSKQIASKCEQIQQTAQIHVVWQKLPRLLKYCPLSPALHICVQENQQQKVARLYNFHHIFNCMYSDISKNSRSRNISHMLDRMLGHKRGHSLRSIPFVMSGHLILNFFQTLGLPIFNTNPNNGCPKRIYQHSGQAHKHFSHRFHGVSFLADVQTWRSKQKFVFIATNPPQYQNFCTQCTKIITSVSNDIAR